MISVACFRTLSQGSPSSPLCLVIRLWPSMFAAKCFASSGLKGGGAENKTHKSKKEGENRWRKTNAQKCISGADPDIGSLRSRDPGAKSMLMSTNAAKIRWRGTLQSRGPGVKIKRTKKNPNAGRIRWRGFYDCAILTLPFSRNKGYEYTSRFGQLSTKRVKCATLEKITLTLRTLILTPTAWEMSHNFLGIRINHCVEDAGPSRKYSYVLPESDTPESFTNNKTRP